MGMERLAWDVTVEVLSFLPADDLLRFRAVCEAWRSLIDSPDFIKLHLSRSAETRVLFGSRIKLWWADPEAADSPQRLGSPVDVRTGIYVIGSSNGLVALGNSDDRMAIWNPTTRRRVTFPDSARPDPAVRYYCNVGLGFGYDPASDDYKLVRLMSYHQNSLLDNCLFCEAKVYSLRAKAWKKAHDFPAGLRYDQFSRSSNAVANAVHWLVARASDESRAVLAFDLSAERARELPLPDHTDIRAPSKIVELGGQLCITVNVIRDEEGVGVVDVWVMEEYGAGESWTRLFSVGPRSCPRAFFRSAVPIVYLKGGDRVLLNWNCERFAVYDLKRNRVVKLGKFYEFQSIVNAGVCVKSLVGN